ncbi:MAG: UMP kinase [Rickettsiales bacterium]|nr:UMP kinase [Rickettsiales bacterium]
MNKPLYKHILLKLSGEALMGNKEFGIDLKTISQITEQISSIFKDGIKISIVVGGGNIFRGISAETIGMDRTSADYTGMMATVINALLLQNSLEKLNLPTRVLSAIKMDTICEPYIKRRAIRHIEKNRIVIFAAGTGNPFFTTDTAAALRASEMKCDVIFKATKVDGIYDSDPFKNKNAKRFKEISFGDVIKKDLKIMDTSAISLSKENNISIIVFSLLEKNSLVKVSRGLGEFTKIS